MTVQTAEDQACDASSGPPEMAPLPDLIHPSQQGAVIKTARTRAEADGAELPPVQIAAESLISETFVINLGSNLWLSSSTRGLTRRFRDE